MDIQLQHRNLFTPWILNSIYTIKFIDLIYNYIFFTYLISIIKLPFWTHFSISDPEETKDIELTVQTLHTAPVCQQLPPLGHKLKRRHKLCCVLWRRLNNFIVSLNDFFYHKLCIEKINAHMKFLERTIWVVKFKFVVNNK